MKTRCLMSFLYLLLLGCAPQKPAWTPYAVEDPELRKYLAENPMAYDLYRRQIDKILRSYTPQERPPAREYPHLLTRQPSESYGQKVYSADECIGAIVNGVCHGSILPKTATHPTCHGTMLNGQCTGPMF